MRTFVLGSAALAALIAVGSAQAADLSPKPAPVYKAPAMVPPAWTWTGFYAGLNLGYSFGRAATTATLTDTATGALVGTVSDNVNMNGVIGGGQIGYNYQITNWVLGIEADIQGSGQRGTANFVCVGCGDGPSNINDAFEAKLLWFGTVRGRVGVTVTPTLLAYATGGLAYGEVKATDTLTGPTVNGPGSATLTASQTRAGWTVGAGLEGVISGNWTARVEYLYMDLGTIAAGPVPTTIIGTVRNPLSASFSSRITDNIVRAGVNYKF